MRFDLILNSKRLLFFVLSAMLTSHLARAATPGLVTTSEGFVVNKVAPNPNEPMIYVNPDTLKSTEVMPEKASGAEIEKSECLNLAPNIRPGQHDTTAMDCFDEAVAPGAPTPPRAIYACKKTSLGREVAVNTNRSLSDAFTKAQPKLGQDLLKAAVTFIPKSYFNSNAKKSLFSLNNTVPTLAEKNSICQGDMNAKDRKLLAPGMCSGFLTGADEVSTAAHCFGKDTDPKARTKSCENYYIVFDFQDGTTNYNSNQVFECGSISQKGSGWSPDTEIDAMKVKLKRAPTGRVPMQISTDAPTAGQRLCNVGSPQGLGLRLNFGDYKGNVNARGIPYYSSTLDSFGGSSGSAVFDCKTCKVIGMLAQGRKDYNVAEEKDPKTGKKYKCRKTAVYDAREGGGELILPSQHFFNKDLVDLGGPVPSQGARK